MTTLHRVPEVPQPPLCAWCNARVGHGCGVMSFGELICDECIEETHGDAAWDRPVST